MTRYFCETCDAVLYEEETQEFGHVEPFEFFGERGVHRFVVRVCSCCGDEVDTCEAVCIECDAAKPKEGSDCCEQCDHAYDVRDARVHTGIACRSRHITEQVRP